MERARESGGKGVKIWRGHRQSHIHCSYLHIRAYAYPTEDKGIHPCNVITTPRACKENAKNQEQGTLLQKHSRPYWYHRSRHAGPTEAQKPSSHQNFPDEYQETGVFGGITCTVATYARLTVITEKPSNRSSLRRSEDVHPQHPIRSCSSRPGRHLRR